MDDQIINTRVSHYLITERVKAGGVAVVYKARDERDGSYVALKVLQSNWAEHPEVVYRFQREAKIMRYLEHPHIVPLLDEGLIDNRPYITMAYMQGGSLSERLKRITSISLGGSSKLLMQIASALDYAHRKNVIHRDLKPGNILMRDSSHAVLTDFGIARRITEHTMITMTGQMPGTPHYMSPEQAKGIEDISEQSDQYSLGVIGYLLATGRLPFGGSDAQVIIYQHLNAEPPKPTERNADLPRALDSVLLRALEKRPEHRFRTAEAFAQAFAQAIIGFEDVMVSIGGSKPDGALASSEDETESIDSLSQMSKVFSTEAPAPPPTSSFMDEEPYPPSRPLQKAANGRLMAIGGVLAALILVGGLALGVSNLGSGGESAISAAQTATAESEALIVAAGLTEAALITPTDEPTPTATVTATDEPAESTEAATDSMTQDAALAVDESATAPPTATATSPASATARATVTRRATSTPRPTQTATATSTATATALPTVTPTATATNTLTATPSATFTPTVTLTSTSTPTATPLFPSWQGALSVISTETGTPGRFNCVRFLQAYRFLDELISTDPMLPPALSELVRSANSPMQAIYVNTCVNAPDNIAAFVESVLFQDMRREITRLLQ